MIIVIVASTTDCETIEGVCLSDDSGIVYEPGVVVPAPPLASELADTGVGADGLVLGITLVIAGVVIAILVRFAALASRP